LNRDIQANSRSYFTGFYTHPRSSLSKTPLRLANATGIIDAGYRGNLIGMFDCNSGEDHDYTSELFSRLLQICAPSLMPIFVDIVENIEELGPVTSRGGGGIGSTGI
jgi:dUTPase